MDVTPLQITLWTSAVSLTGLLVGHWLRLGGDRRQRRRTFRGKLRSIAAALEAARFPVIYDAYQKTIPEVRDLCANIREDISWYHRRSLDAACVAYCTLKEPEIHPGVLQSLRDPSVSNEERKRMQEAGRRLVCDRLQRVIKCA